MTKKEVEAYEQGFKDGTEQCLHIINSAIDLWFKAGHPECAEVQETMRVVEAIKSKEEL
jgi:hypothetical protein